MPVVVAALAREKGCEKTGSTIAARTPAGPGMKFRRLTISPAIPCPFFRATPRRTVRALACARALRGHYRCLPLLRRLARGRSGGRIQTGTGPSMATAMHHATDGSGANAICPISRFAHWLTRIGLRPSCRSHAPRTRTRIAIRGDILGGAAMGVCNILCLTGTGSRREIIRSKVE